MSFSYTTHDRLMVSWSRGKGTNLGKVKSVTNSWKKFRAIHETPFVTSETVREFQNLNDDDKRDKKRQDGYVFAAPVEDGTNRTRRSTLPRDIASFDYDYGTPEFLVEIECGFTPLSEYEFFIHTTRSHTAESPRFRLFMPMSRKVKAEEWGRLSRIIAFFMEGSVNPMPMVDKVSFRPAQMMFAPTISTDGIFKFFHNPGKLIDPDEFFQSYRDETGLDPEDLSTLPRAAGESEIRVSADKAEDPFLKKGMVGDFCRAYPISKVISTFLENTYALSDDAFSNKPRYTYIPGSGANGAEVEDDDRFLYSFHGTDPCGERLVNSFDLVRIHMFGDLDAKTDKDTAQTKLPSWKAMQEFVADLPDYQKAQSDSRYDTVAMFEGLDNGPADEDDDDPEPDTPAEAPETVYETEQEREDWELIHGAPAAHKPRSESKAFKRKRHKPADDWHLGLEVGKDGKILNTLTNIANIFQNDPRIANCLEYNDFRDQAVMREPMRSNMEIVPVYKIEDEVSGDPIQDHHGTAMRAILEGQNGPGKKGWGMKVSQIDLNDAIDMCARHRSFHPIRERLIHLTWDGVGRIATLWHDYMGVADNAYTRETAMLWMVAAVTRAFEPGHKFDFVPVLEGVQGIRKSTFSKILAFGFFGELKGDFGDPKVMSEIMAGSWIMECPELGSVHRSKVEDMKAFLSGTETVTRPAFGRRAKVYKRQCVFIGSTNGETYLTDPTGNRRIWPIRCQNQTIDTEELERNLDQLWAEAYHTYCQMRAAQPVGPLPLYLRDAKSQRIALTLQEGARLTNEVDDIMGEIQAWLQKPILLDSNAKMDGDKTMVLRQETCVKEVQAEAISVEKLGRRPSNHSVGNALKKLGWHYLDGKKRVFPGYDNQARYVRTPRAQALWEADGGKPFNPVEVNDDEDLI